MVNGVNGVIASKPVKNAFGARKSVPLDLTTVETKHEYSAEVHERLFKLETAPTYRPSASEFANPLQYIEQIAPHAKRYGICKIIPPHGWKPDFAIDTEVHSRVPCTSRTDKPDLQVQDKKART